MPKKELKFKFNLVTPITQEEILIYEERDNTIVNSFILIFAGVFVFTILNILYAAFIEPALIDSKAALEIKESSLLAFNEAKSLNGEFVIKSRALSPLLDTDIKPDKLVEIVDNLVSTLSEEVDIDSFGRERNGGFIIQAFIRDLESLDLIKSFFDSNTQDVNNLFFSEVNNSSEGLLVTIKFDIIV